MFDHLQYFRENENSMKNVLKICKIICNKDAHVLNIHLLSNLISCAMPKTEKHI